MMRLRDFIRTHRAEIDAVVMQKAGEACKPANDREREQWVLNHEPLYLWAQRENVPV